MVLLPLVIGEGVLGIASVGEGTSTGSPLLFAHIALGTGLAIAAAWLVVMTIRLRDRRARWATALTAAALLSTAITGSIFLLTGFSQGLDVDRALGLASIAGTILMILSGSKDASLTRTK